jgi:signal transduction histidine kinase
VTAKHKDGALFPIELSVTEIAVDDEVHYAAFIRDISEKTRLQEKLIESEKLAAIGNTAAKIAHEIANPLNGIYLTLQLVEQRLTRRSAADEPALSNVVKIKKEIARLNQLVRDFRSLARQQTYDFRPMRLAALIDEVVDLQQPLLESHGVVVERSISDDVPVVRVDEDKLKQALLNLLKNAAEAMPAGGFVSIAVQRRTDDIMIEIRDTGMGIPPGTDIFAPFVTTKKDGTGLGLLIVWQVATAHGGTISYDSQPGKGATFRLTLPLSPKQIP